MNKTNVSALMFISTAVLLVTIRYCTSSQRYVFHEVGFNCFDECKDVDVLDWRYGDQTGLHADKNYVAAGHISQRDMTAGMFPIGTSLYVKWKYLPTGMIYEENVDLTDRLPSDMEQKTVYFLIRENKLHIYLIEGEDKNSLHAVGAPDCPAHPYDMFKCEIIYPSRWTNF